MGSATSTENGKLAVTSVKIPRHKLDRLREVALAEQRNVSQQIRYLIDRCIEESAA